MFTHPRHHGKTEAMTRLLFAEKAAGRDPIVYCHPDHAQHWRDLGFKVWCDRPRAGAMTYLDGYNHAR